MTGQDRIETTGSCNNTQFKIDCPKHIRHTQLSRSKLYSGGSTLLLRQMLPNLCPDEILLMDRYYESYWTSVSLKMQGVDTLTPKRGNRKIDWTQGIHLGDNDRLFTWQKPNRPEWVTEEPISQHCLIRGVTKKMHYENYICSAGISNQTYG